MSETVTSLNRKNDVFLLFLLVNTKISMRMRQCFKYVIFLRISKEKNQKLSGKSKSEKVVQVCKI